MKTDINSVHLTGHIASKPQLRNLPSGLPVLNAKLQTTSGYLAKDHNEMQLNLVFYGVFAEQQLAKLKEGDRVCIEGEILTRSTSATEKRTTTEIVVEKIYALTNGSTAQSGRSDEWDI
jgi:single-stranded DNA-binding protein